MPQVVVIGAGVTGLACALTLCEHDIDFEIFERCERPGGHARTDTIGSFRFDHGPHVLVGIPKAAQPLFSRLNIGLAVRTCNSSIYYGGDWCRHIPAPIQSNLGTLPVGVRLSCIRDYFAVRRRLPTKSGTYRQVVERKLGRGLVELFLAPYDSKRLTYSLDEIHSAYSDRVPCVSPSQLLWSAVISPAAKHGLDSRFLYPAEGGIEELPKALGHLVPRARLHTSANLIQLNLASRRLAFEDGRVAHFDILVSSIPLVNLVRLIDVVPSNIREATEDLAWGSTYVFNVGFDGPLGGPHGIIRYPEHDISFYRLSFPASYAVSAMPRGYDAVVAEVGYHPQRRPKSGAEALARVHADLQRTGIVGDGINVVVEQTIDIPISHVVHTPRTPNSLGHIREWLISQDIYSCGKYGEWRELLMPQSMLSGQHVAEGIVQRLSGE